jgi:hypothetical protein
MDIDQAVKQFPIFQAPLPSRQRRFLVESNFARFARDLTMVRRMIRRILECGGKAERRRRFPKHQLARFKNADPNVKRIFSFLARCNHPAYF